jgi:hypothetical protein
MIEPKAVMRHSSAILPASPSRPTTYNTAPVTQFNCYVDFMEQVANIAPPFKVEEGVEGWKLVHTGVAFGSAGHGTMYEDLVVH